jgi:TRAP-type C4-dicarboxylate transport system substrate-binding protein
MTIPRYRAVLTVLALAVAAICVAPAAGAAEKKELRIATVAPSGSSFHKRLQSLSAEWSRGPGGVSMNIYAGTQGGELQIVRRMRVGQIQGAMLTSVGLAQIERSVTALQLMPLMFHDWDDVDRVRERLRPDLEARLLAAGYVVLFWGDGGWVRYFSNKPIKSVHDLKRCAWEFVIRKRRTDEDGHARGVEPTRSCRDFATARSTHRCRLS